MGVNATEAIRHYWRNDSSFYYHEFSAEVSHRSSARLHHFSFRAWLSKEHGLGRNSAKSLYRRLMRRRETILCHTLFLQVVCSVSDSTLSVLQLSRAITVLNFVRENN
jgi:hypothetical protein